MEAGITHQEVSIQLPFLLPSSQTGMVTLVQQTQTGKVKCTYCKYFSKNYYSPWSIIQSRKLPVLIHQHKVVFTVVPKFALNVMICQKRMSRRPFRKLWNVRFSQSSATEFARNKRELEINRVITYQIRSSTGKKESSRLSESHSLSECYYFQKSSHLVRFIPFWVYVVESCKRCFTKSERDYSYFLIRLSIVSWISFWRHFISISGGG